MVYPADPALPPLAEPPGCCGVLYDKYSVTEAECDGLYDQSDVTLVTPGLPDTGGNPVGSWIEQPIDWSQGQCTAVIYVVTGTPVGDLPAVPATPCAACYDYYTALWDCDQGNDWTVSLFLSHVTGPPFFDNMGNGWNGDCSYVNPVRGSADKLVREGDPSGGPPTQNCGPC